MYNVMTTSFKKPRCGGGGNERKHGEQAMIVRAVGCSCIPFINIIFFFFKQEGPSPDKLTLPH